MYVTVAVNVFALCCLLIALKKNKMKTKKAIVIAWKSFIRILPRALIVIIFIGLLLGFVPKEEISKFIGEQAGFQGVLLTASLGAVMHIPSILAFPLAGSLLEGGASITAVAVFITTLTMIGIATIPLEIKELGVKLTLLRNGMSFIIAIIIGVLMGVLL